MARFDGAIAELADAFGAVARAMLNVVLSFAGGGAGFDEANAAVEEAGEALSEESARWVEATLPAIYADGVQQALSSPQTPSVDSQALAHNVHDSTLNLLMQDLTDALSAATESMSRNAKTNLREIARRRLAASLNNGTNARDEARRMEAELRDRGVRVVDRSGREWDPRAYSEMTLRTHTVKVSNQANLNTSAELGSPGVRIHDGGPGDVDLPCEEADGQAWSLAYFQRNLLQHPNCRRSASPLPSTFSEPLDRE